MSESEINQTISRNLQKYLDKNNRTQQELAEFIGVSQATVSNWCKGTKMPRMSKVDMICGFLGINRSDLMNEESSDYSSLLRLDETQLLSYYNKLNHIGMGKAMEYVQDLSEQPKYIEPEEAGVEEPVKKRRT